MAGEGRWWQKSLIPLDFWNQLQVLRSTGGALVQETDLTGGIGLRCLTGMAVDFEAIVGVGLETLDDVRDRGAA